MHTSLNACKAGRPRAAGHQCTAWARAGGLCGRNQIGLGLPRPSTTSPLPQAVHNLPTSPSLYAQCCQLNHGMRDAWGYGTRGTKLMSGARQGKLPMGPHHPARVTLKAVQCSLNPNPNPKPSACALVCARPGRCPARSSSPTSCPRPPRARSSGGTWWQPSWDPLLQVRGQPSFRGQAARAGLLLLLCIMPSCRSRWCASAQGCTC